MTTPGRGCFSSLVLIVWAAALSVPALPQAGTHTIPLAGSPPMGWNSWDCYGTSVTEAQVKANADYMSKNLLSHGWQYIVVDIQWSEPNARAGGYNPEPHLDMDKYGRLIPAVNRFPASADGKGFKPLADYIHSLGLKFGIHIMRGIPRQAVAGNTPVEGAAVHAADIANKYSVCRCSNDISRPYMSLFQRQTEYLLAISAAWTAAPSTGVFPATACRGMPRMMWMPNFRPSE